MIEYTGKKNANYIQKKSLFLKSGWKMFILLTIPQRWQK